MIDPIYADSVVVGNCADDCKCQNVHLLHCDDEGDVISAMTLGPDQARAVARDLIAAADQADLMRARQAGRVA